MQPDPIGYIVLTLKAHREGDQYVSECFELGTASCGDTLEEAFDNVKDATILYLNTLESVGEREGILREAGIKLFPGEPPQDGDPVLVPTRPDEYVSPEVVRIPVLL